MTTAKHLEGVKELTETEARDLFERQAQHYLDVTGEEFLRAWRAGEYAGREDAYPVAHVVKLLPLVEGFGTRGGE